MDWPPQPNNPSPDFMWGATSWKALLDCRAIATRTNSIYLGGPDLDGTLENGFKHCVGACCLAARLGADLALYYLDQHEIDTMQQMRVKYAKDPKSLGIADHMRKIDNLNNRLGVTFGLKAAACVSPSNCCARMCLCAFHGGQLAAV